MILRLFTAFSLIFIAMFARADQEWTTTASGLKYRIVEPGSGPLPKQGQVVVFHYVGTLEDGTEFGNSRERNSPAGFTVGGEREQVLAGWKEALALLHVGDKAEVLIPPSLGFGDRKQGRIPPNSTLRYQIELLAVKNHNLAEDLDEAMAKSGVDAGKKLYQSLKAGQFSDHYVGEAHLRGIGKVYLQAGRFPEAIAFAEWNVEQFPKSVQAHEDLAEAALTGGELQKALQTYRSILEIDSSNARAKQQLALFETPVEAQFADTNGQSVDLARLRGKVVLLQLWSTWSPPAVAELPALVSLYKKNRKKDFEIIGISFELAPGDTPAPQGIVTKSLQEFKAFNSSKRVFWPQYYDGKALQNKFAEQFSVQALPTTYLLDKSGKIVAVNLRGPKLEAEVKRLLD